MEVYAPELVKLKNAKERRLVQEWVDVVERTPEKIADLVQDIWGMEDREKALQKGSKILLKPNVKYAIKVTMQRRSTTTPEKLEKGADKAMDFLDETMDYAREQSDPVSDDEASIAQKIAALREARQNRALGVRAAGTLLGTWAKDKANAPVDKIELLKEELGEELAELADMDPKELMKLAEGGDGI